MGAEKRAAEREPCLIEASVRLDANPRPLACIIENISETGAKLRFASDQKLPPSFVLMVPLVGDHHEEKPVDLRWQIGGAVGVRFRSLLAPSA